MASAAAIVREIRDASGLSFAALAERAHTSAATLSAYESGRKEPRLSTLERIAAAADADLRVVIAPRLTVSEHLALALHQAAADKLRANPERVIRQAKRSLATIRVADSGQHAIGYLDAWEQLLELPVDALAAAMTSTSQIARDLRQSSPFAGVLSDSEIRSVVARHGHRAQGKHQWSATSSNM